MAERILIVEDDQNLSDLLAAYLDAAGYEAECLNAGRDVLSSLEGGSFDAVLLDIMLPDVRDLSLCAKIRETFALPILIITALTGEDDRIAGLDIGADDYLCKPFSPRECVSRVRAVLRRTKAAASADPDRERPLRIDFENQLVFWEGRNLDFTRTEFEIMGELFHNEGLPRTREQLSAATRTSEPTSNRAIDSHIKNIRKKITTAAPHADLIHSVYGIGYRFEFPDDTNDGGVSGE